MVSNAEPPHSQNNNQIWECLPTTSNYVDNIAFSPDGKVLVSHHWRIKLWDVATGQQLNFSGNGEVLVSSYSDGTIAVWQQKKGLV